MKKLKLWWISYHFIIFKPFIAVFVSISSLKEIVSNSFLQGYRIVSSAKLQISVSFMKRSKLLIRTLKRIGPNIDPCGSPGIICNHLLKDEPTFTVCCRLERESCMSLKLFSQTPYASSFAIIKTSLTQSQAFIKSINNVPTIL